MNNQAAQTMPELPASVLADLIDWHKRDGTKKGKLTTQALQELAEYRTRAAALSQTAGVVEGKRDREADRLRFPDADFNAWLDAGISDAGHTVYDLISSIEDAWQGWHGHVLSVMLDENPDLDAMLAAAPAASGGESAASVSERARDERFTAMLIGIIADVQDALGFTDEDKECSNGSLEIVSAIRELQEQALTQQRGEAAASGEGVDDTKRLDWIARQGGYEFDFGILNDQPGDGDWFVHGMVGSGQGATFRDAIDAAIKEEAGGQDANTDILDTLAFKTENGDAGRGSVTYIALVASGEADHATTTPQPSADAVRELVKRWVIESNWRSGGVRATYKRCADELESLLSAASGEKGVG